MQSTLKLRESDPHDVFTIAPDIVPASWADKVLADITRDTQSHSDLRPLDQPLSARAAAAPQVDMTFRATAANDSRAATVRAPKVQIPDERPAGPSPTRSWLKKTTVAFLFALCSAMAAAAWQHYGATAKQMIAAWTPPFSLNLSAAQPTGLAAQPDKADVEASAQTSASDQAPAQAPAADDAAPPPPAASADAAQLQSMARDLAAMGQEVELLKATVAELKSAQQPVVRDAAKTSELKPSLPNPRPRITAPLPRTAALPARKPAQIYPAQNYPSQTYPAQAYPPVQAAAPPPPASLQSAPPPPPITQADDQPVLRPPMPLH
jgi:hypothetical protein